MNTEIYGDSDDLVEFDGAIYGEASWYSVDPAKIKLKAPDGTKMRLTAQFCGERNKTGWFVEVTDNPGEWPWEHYRSDRHGDDDELDIGVRVDVPAGTKAKCNGERVR